MLHLIKEELEEQDNYSLTENGAVGYKSSKSALVDINYKVASLRNSNEDEIVALFDEAFKENKEYALKWLFFARDIREGLGERRLFRICYKRLFELDNILFKQNLHNIAEYGRWDDLVALIGISYGSDKHIADMILEQLAQDIIDCDNDKSISLLAKWLPSENASSKQTKALAKNVIKLLGISPRQYRLMLSKLRAHLNVVETRMCSNKWSEIDYEKVPSLANLKYKDAFMKHDMERRLDYLSSVAKGESKLNMKVATPVDVVAKYRGETRYRWSIRDFDPTLELAWKNLKDIMVEDTLVVADGSGSMLAKVSGDTTALDVANALAIYTSEHNSGVYKDKYITFSSRPRFVDFSKANSLCEKIQIAKEYSEVSNTNIEAVFSLILQTAIKNSIPQNEMIKNILIISDMEFDEAQRMWRSSDPVLTQPLFDLIKRRYSDAGYALPKLIFWNVNSRTQTIPLVENELGVALVSGFSQNVLKMVMTNNLNPYDILVEAITSPRYDAIVCK